MLDLFLNRHPLIGLALYRRQHADPGVEKTVSGSTIHVTDALSRNVKSLTVDIEPTQAGTGDPSPTNIRSFTGWTKCDITHESDNLIVDTVSVNFPSPPGTVYHGTLDVTTGVLSVDQAYVEVSSDSTISKISKSGSGAAYFRIKMDGQMHYGTSSFGMCSHLPSANIASGNTQIGFVPYRTGSSPNYTYGFSFRFPEDVVPSGDVDAMKAYADEQIAAGTPIQFVGQYVDPVEYQLTPEQIKLFLGSNTLYADAGDISLTYLAKSE